jgi:hypothetical protein
LELPVLKNSAEMNAGDELWHIKSNKVMIGLSRTQSHINMLGKDVSIKIEYRTTATMNPHQKIKLYAL